MNWRKDPTTGKTRTKRKKKDGCGPLTRHGKPSARVSLGWRSAKKSESTKRDSQVEEKEESLSSRKKKERQFEITKRGKG